VFNLFDRNADGRKVCDQSNKAHMHHRTEAEWYKAAYLIPSGTACCERQAFKEEKRQIKPAEGGADQ